jgi:hypothetical protein
MKNLIHLNKAQTKHLLEDKAEVASPLRVQVEGDASQFGRDALHLAARA